MVEDSREPEEEITATLACPRTEVQGPQNRGLRAGS